MSYAICIFRKCYALEMTKNDIQSHLTMYWLVKKTRFPQIWLSKLPFGLKLHFGKQNIAWQAQRKPPKTTLGRENVHVKGVL